MRVTIRTKSGQVLVRGDLVASPMDLHQALLQCLAEFELHEPPREVVQPDGARPAAAGAEAPATQERPRRRR